LQSPSSHSQNHHDQHHHSSSSSSERFQYNEVISSLSSLTVIGHHAILTQCDEILNCVIGPYSQITQTRSISDTTIHSSRFHPVIIKRASELKKVIMLPHTTAGDECRVRNVQMFEHSSISGGALVEVPPPPPPPHTPALPPRSPSHLSSSGMCPCPRCLCWWWRMSSFSCWSTHWIPSQLSSHLFCLALWSRKPFLWMQGLSLLLPSPHL
jgi:hypothetical protein